MNITQTLEQLLEARKTRMIEIFEENLLIDRVKVQNTFDQAVKHMTGMIQKTESEWKPFVVRLETNVSCGDPEANTLEELNTLIEERALQFWTITALMHQHEVAFTDIKFDQDWSSRSWAKTRWYNILENTTTWGNHERRISTDEEIHEAAVKLTEEALASFVCKMAKKLAAIGEVSEAQIDDQWNNLDQTCLSLAFKNGITFSLVNSIVFKTSSKGNPFMQFPARFSNVSLNGEFQKGCASEAGVKKLSKTLF